MSDSDGGDEKENEELPERPSSVGGLEDLSYRDLQKLAKDAEIKANQKTEELVKALAEEYGLGEEGRGDNEDTDEETEVKEGPDAESGDESAVEGKEEDSEEDESAEGTEEGEPKEEHPGEGSEDADESDEEGEDETDEESQDDEGDEGEEEPEESEEDEEEEEGEGEEEEKTTKDRLAELGFYDNDFTEFPPELSGVKRFKVEGNSRPIVEALDIVNSVFMKHEMVEALGRVGDEAAVDKLVEQVDDNDTREEAIEALGIAGSERGTKRLVELLNPEKRVKPHVRAMSAEALGRIGDPEAVGALVTLLTGEGLKDEEEEEESEGEGDEEDGEYEPPESARVRGAVAEALGSIGRHDDGAVEALVGLLEDDPDETVRLTAARALSNIDDEAARDALAEYADDRNELVAQKARKAGA